MRNLQKQGRAAAHCTGLRRGALGQLAEVDGPAAEVEMTVNDEGAAMRTNLTPKQAVVHAFPLHGDLDTERIVALLQYLFKEGFVEESVGASVRFTAEGRSVVARRRRELGLPE